MLAPLVGLGKGEPLLLLSQHPDYTHRPDRPVFKPTLVRCSGSRLAAVSRRQRVPFETVADLGQAESLDRQGARPAEAHPV